MELSHWNYMNTLVYSGIVVVTAGVVGGIGAAVWYYYKKINVQNCKQQSDFYRYLVHTNQIND